MTPPPSFRAHSARRSKFPLWLVMCCAAAASGCQTVQPWERGEFASYLMRPDRDPLHSAMAEHIHFSREASSGGRGVGGSGCGCN